MNTELTFLLYVTALTALIWVPYILNTIMVRGVAGAVGYPENPAPLAPWAERMKKAHYNAVENLVVFAPLVLIAHVEGVHNNVTVMACMVYFWARLAHLIMYTFGIPWLRTLSFVAGFGAQAALIWQLCDHAAM